MPTEMTRMKSIASRLSPILTGIVLVLTMIAITGSRLEYCGQPEALRPRIDAVASSATHAPTLAPPQKVVFVRVEVDKADLEVGWAEN
jgi:hypothetical protein